MAATPAIKTTDKSLAQLKEEICDIGRRIYAKGFAAGNDGNISFRLGPNEVLCTPTMISKGFSVDTAQSDDRHQSAPASSILRKA